VTKEGVVSRLAPSSAGHPGPLRALSDRANTVLPGLYAWLATVALPASQHGASASARASAGVALVSLLTAPVFATGRPLVGRALGIYGFIGGSLLTWLLLGASLVQSPGDPLLSALGAVAFCALRARLGLAATPRRRPGGRAQRHPWPTFAAPRAPVRDRCRCLRGHLGERVGPGLPCLSGH